MKSTGFPRVFPGFPGFLLATAEVCGTPTLQQLVVFIPATVGETWLPTVCASKSWCQAPGRIKFQWLWWTAWYQYVPIGYVKMKTQRLGVLWPTTLTFDLRTWDPSSNWVSWEIRATLSFLPRSLKQSGKLGRFVCWDFLMCEPEKDQSPMDKTHATTQ